MLSCLLYYNSTYEERRNKNNKQLVQSRGAKNTYCERVADWTVTLNLTPTLKDDKGKCVNSNVCLNFILEWKITREASVGVSVKNVTVFSLTIFYSADDRLAQKISSQVYDYDYVGEYDAVWSVLTCSSISCTGDWLAQKCLCTYNHRIMQKRMMPCGAY